MQRLPGYFSVLFTIVILLKTNAAIEPWADANLPVKEGLELWLDASRENSPAADFRKVPQGGSLAVWHDASGKQNHLRQPVPEMRPKLYGVLGATSVRFDGRDDFLSAAGLTAKLTNSTVFVRAAPRSNAGGFRALASFSAQSQNDYSSGMNIDQGWNPGSQLETLNVEGPGFTGAQDLLQTGLPFGNPTVFTIIAQETPAKIQLWLNGAAQGSRPRDSKQSLAFEEVAVGARLYSNTMEPPHAQGFFHGEIFDLLIYNRALNDTERAQVEKYLLAKNSGPSAEGRKIVPLETVQNPPPVQMLLPGFEVRELPVKLKNINCLKYRDDGKLVALGYDGSIWLLSDTDGDGLEDKAAAFWERPGALRAPIGMALTPSQYSHGQGLFVASKGKLSLIVDTDKDDIADREIIVAQGWKESSHGVDALGVAVDRDGSIYFGIGTVNFASAYLTDPATGKAAYSLKDERGTILKVSPDFSRREIVCTGIRFPVALAFNAAGDLFCTDQEGSTWLPNGNPLDELLHIQPNRHYGFPPRHPTHLPNVIDEPSVFDYGPQHQSTCGLNFNEPLPGGKFFGPAWWRGDAIVTGYSRGKLWRTSLVKSSSGYVAQNQLIGCLGMMPADACISPAGHLVVAAHSGLPDWGSGPTGDGKLFKISFSNNQPQPVLIWASSDTETTVEFDRALSTEQAREISKQIKIVQGRYAAAGDRFESLRPGYQVVQNQMVEPRYELTILSIALEHDGRTILVRTVPRKQAVTYAVTLPAKKSEKEGALSPAIDLAHDLCGVEAAWINGANSNIWSGWLPHLDLKVARDLTVSGKHHGTFWNRGAERGTLKLRTQLDLSQMLRAATQPGSKLDFVYPTELVTLVFKANAPLAISASSGKVQRTSATESRLAVAAGEDWIGLEASLTTDLPNQPSLEVRWFTEEDSRPRALPLRRLLLPWAVRSDNPSAIPVEREIPEVTGGNWLRGKKLFSSAQLGCSKCHAMAGEGSRVGPDLSNLLHRDYASVMKDVSFPSAAINPDYVSYFIELKTGESLTGIPIGGGEREVHLTDVTGTTTNILRDQIGVMKPSTISLMPEGLLTGLTQQQVKDLFTFLLKPSPLEPAPLEIRGEPPPRKRTETGAFLKPGIVAQEQASKVLRVVLASGPKDHGPGEHDYPLWEKRWSKLLALGENVVVETASGWPAASQFSSADLIIFYSNNPGWTAQGAGELDGFLNRGGGLVYIHYAVDGHAHCDELAQRIGLAWRGGASKFRHGPLDLKFVPHEITAGFEKLQLMDESYWNLTGQESSVQLLASGIEEGKPRPLFWVREQGKGRVFVSIPGHFNWTFDDPLFRLLIFRGMAWTTRQPLDRFNDLVLIGARVE